LKSCPPVTPQIIRAFLPSTTTSSCNCRVNTNFSRCARKLNGLIFRLEVPSSSLFSSAGCWSFYKMEKQIIQFLKHLKHETQKKFHAFFYMTIIIIFQSIFLIVNFYYIVNIIFIIHFAFHLFLWILFSKNE
jgi:hypothetical protein